MLGYRSAGETQAEAMKVFFQVKKRIKKPLGKNSQRPENI